MLCKCEKCGVEYTPTDELDTLCCSCWGQYEFEFHQREAYYEFEMEEGI